MKVIKLVILNKKILQIIDTLNPGGMENVFVDMCNILNRNRAKVTILFTRKPGPLSRKLDSTIKQISLNRRWRFSAIAAVKLLLTFKNYNIIHVHGRYNFSYVKAVISLYPKKKYQVFFHDHYGAIDIDKTVPRILKIFNYGFVYIGVSKSLTDWALNNLGLESNKINLLPNIRDIEPLNIIDNRYHAEDMDIYELVHVANIHPVKNIEFSIKILHQLNIKGEFRLTVYGSIADKTYFESLLSLSKKLGVEKNLLFIHNKSDIPSILGKYDLGLCTSKSESGPLVLIEYLSQGVPFLSFDTGEVVRQTAKKYPFFILDNFDIQKWSSQILDILVNRFTDKKQLIKYFEKKYSDKAYYDKLIDIYSQ